MITKSSYLKHSFIKILNYSQKVIDSCNGNKTEMKSMFRERKYQEINLSLSIKNFFNSMKNFK